MEEKFDYEAVETKMSKVKDYGDQFAKNVQKINESFDKMVQKAPSGAIYGTVGKKILDLWNKNKIESNVFFNNFDSWAYAVAQVESNNIKLEEDAASTGK